MGDEDAAKRLFGLGSQAVKAGDYDSAHAQFSEALASASSVELKSALLVSRSGALGALSRWSEALADAEACRQIRPSWSRTFECKAAALGGLERQAEAEMCTRLAAALASLKQDPKNEELKKKVRAIREEIAAFEASPEAQQQATPLVQPPVIPSAPQDPSATPPTPAAPAPTTAPGAENQPQAECEEAKTNFQKGTQSNKAEDYGEAYRFFSEGLSTARTVELKSALLVSRSAALCGMNRYEEALLDADECIKIRRSWARSYSCQAAALNGLGRTEAAERCRRLASALAELKQDPKNEDLKKMVRTIRQEMATNASKQALGASAPALDLGPTTSTLPETVAPAQGDEQPPPLPIDPPEVIREPSPQPAPRDASPPPSAGASAPALDLGPTPTLPETQAYAQGDEQPPAPPLPMDPPEVIHETSPKPPPRDTSPAPIASQVSESVAQAESSTVTGRWKAMPPPTVDDRAAWMSPPSDSVDVPQTVIAAPVAEFAPTISAPPVPSRSNAASSQPASITLNERPRRQAESDAAKLIVSQANQLQRQNNFEGAHALYTNALLHARYDELRSAIYFNRGIALARMQRWEESLMDANECVKINPTWPRGAECQGTALEGLGRLPEALAAFATALDLEPDNEAIKQTMRDIQGIMKSEKSLPPQQIGNPGSMLVHPNQHKSPPSLPDILPQLIKPGSSHNAGPDAFVQVDVEGNRRWAKWVVKRCDAGLGEISFRDFFPTFPNLVHAHSGMNEVLSHAIHICGVRANEAPKSPGRQPNLALTIPPPSECNLKTVLSVVLENCYGVQVLVDEIEDEIQMIGCRDLELVLGGHPPKSGLMLLDCVNCSILVSEKTWRMLATGDDQRGVIRTNSCSHIYLMLIREAPQQDGAAMNAASICNLRQNRQNVEKVLLPDSFFTKLTDGALSTVCEFSTEEGLKAIPRTPVYSTEAGVPPKQEMATSPRMPINSPSIAPAALAMTRITDSPVQQPKSVERPSAPLPKPGDFDTPLLGSGVLQFKLILGLDGNTMGAGNNRHTFENALVNDLANSSALARNNFRIISIVGDLVVNVEAQLKIQEGVYFDSMQLATIFEREFTDPTSQFRNGAITQYSQGIGFPFDLGMGIVGFRHKLDIPFSDAGTEGSVERLAFQNKYLFDLCTATGVEPTRFHIKNVSPGSVIIETEIHPDALGRGPLARNVFASLDKQAMDPASQLRFGEVTCFTKAEAQAGRIGQLPRHESPPPDVRTSIPMQIPHDLPPAIPITSAAQKGTLPPPPSTLPPPEYGSMYESKERNGTSSQQHGNSRSGIGVAVAKKEEGFSIADILPGSPAFMGGLQVGEILVAIDDQPLDDLELTDVVRMLRGPPGSSTKVEVRRKLTGSMAVQGQSVMQYAILVTRPSDDLNKTPIVKVLAPSPVSNPPRSQVNPHDAEISQTSPGKRVGIGLGLSKDETGHIRVSDILSGSICARDGSIQRNDVLEKVDGVSVDGMNPNDVVSLLRGNENTLVKLDMKRNNWNPTDPTLDIRFSVVLERSASEKLVHPQALSPPEDVPVSLTLDMHMWQIGETETFKREVAVDVASALGPLVTKVKTVGIRSGSVIVDLMLTPRVERTGPHVVEQLVEQARNPSSPLRTGKHTNRTSAVHSGALVSQSLPATLSLPVTKLIPRARPSPMVGTLGPSSAFRDNPIVRESEMDVRYNYSQASRRGAPVPLVPQPESIALANEKGEAPRAGIGLGLTAGKGLVYTVCGLTPGGAAETSGQLQKGDVVHSIDGVLVTGKTVAEIQDVVIGEVGTKVMVAVLRSDALPEDLELDLHQFERWRPVVLVRSIPRSQHEIQQQNGSLFSSQQSVRSMQHYGSNGSAQKCVWPMRNGREVIAVDLFLDEDYRVVAPTVADKALFTAQITNDISTALRVSSTQVSVVDLLPGSVIAVVEFLHADDHAGAKDPEDIALELMRQASNDSSPLRQSVSCRRAKYARPRMMETLIPLKAEATDRTTPYNGSSSMPSSDDDMVRMEGGGQWLELGLVLSKGSLDRFCTVQLLRHGGPAEQSGCIFIGNLVTSIDGRSMDGVSLDQVVKFLGEGDWGTVVNVGVMRLQGTRGALPDQNITTVVALRRGLRQNSSAASLFPPSPPRASEEEIQKFEYTGPCRVVVLQRKPHPTKARVGVGIVLQRLLSSQQLIIVGMPETGVAKASEQVFIGDVLHQVDNVPTSGRSVEDVVKMLQGFPGTSVVLMLQSTTRQREALQASNHSNLFSSRRSDTYRSAKMPSYVTLRRIYPTPDESAPFRTLRDGSPAGVVGLGLEHVDCSFVISRLAANGSAAQSGMIFEGSKLVSVDDTDVKLASLDEIYHVLCGRVDTEVTIGFYPPDSNQPPDTDDDFMEIPASAEVPADNYTFAPAPSHPQKPVHEPKDRSLPPMSYPSAAQADNNTPKSPTPATKSVVMSPPSAAQADNNTPKSPTPKSVVMSPNPETPVTPNVPTVVSSPVASPSDGIPVTKHQFSGASLSGAAVPGLNLTTVNRQVSSGADISNPTPLASPTRAKAKDHGSATVSLLVIAATNLEKRQGESVECKIRLLHPTRKPIVIGTFKGVWNAGSGKAEFKSSPYVFDIEKHEVDRAQVEATLWEPAPNGCVCVGAGVHEHHVWVCERWCLGQKGRGFIGEVIINANRLHAMAKQQPAKTLEPLSPLKPPIDEHELSQDFEFACKPGWTFKPVRPVEAKMSIRFNYKAR